MIKKLLPFLLLVIACNSTPDLPGSKACVENYLDALKMADFETADQYYSDSYGLSDSKEDRLGKMRKLHEVLGEVVSYQLTDSLVEENFGEPTKIMLTYDVRHRKANTEEKYTVMKDEGNFRIVSQEVENK
jgi:hypothetical protein